MIGFIFCIRFGWKLDSTNEPCEIYSNFKNGAILRRGHANGDDSFPLFLLPLDPWTALPHFGFPTGPKKKVLKFLSWRVQQRLSIDINGLSGSLGKKKKQENKNCRLREK